MNEELTAADINQLRAYVESDSGRKLLMQLVNRETTLLAQAYSNKSSFELQGQNVNRVSGIYWVRSLISDLIEPKKAPKKKK